MGRAQRDPSIVAKNSDGYRCRSTHPTSYEQLKRDPQFVDDSVDAIVMVMTPQKLAADAQS